jgi:hypothetical protein
VVRKSRAEPPSWARCPSEEIPCRSDIATSATRSSSLSPALSSPVVTSCRMKCARDIHSESCLRDSRIGALLGSQMQILDTAAQHIQGVEYSRSTPVGISISIARRAGSLVVSQQPSRKIRGPIRSVDRSIKRSRSAHRAAVYSASILSKLSLIPSNDLNPRSKSRAHDRVNAPTPQATHPAKDSASVVCPQPLRQESFRARPARHQQKRTAISGKNLSCFWRNLR